MNFDFNNICRLCLKLTEETINLFPKNGVRDLSKEETDKIIEKIEYCYSIQIKPGDELPTKICHKCIQIVTLFYITKQNIFQSDQFLKNSLLLKRLAEQDDGQNLGSSDKATSENENNGYTSGSSIQIIGESLLKPQELPKTESQNFPSPIPSGSHKWLESQEPSCNDESALKNDFVNKSAILFPQSNNKILVKSNVNNENVAKISSKASRLGRKVIRKRARRLLKKKRSNNVVATINDGEDNTTPRDKLHAQENKDCRLNEPHGNEIKLSDEKYLKERGSEYTTTRNCKIEEFSHDLNINALENTSSSSQNSFTPVKNSKIKSELENGKTKLLVKSPKNKEDKLKDYYEKLLHADKSLKVEYCRLTSQKSKLRKEMALEKKKTHDVNMKIYNLVRVTVNITNAVSEMTNFNEKEKMEKVFDRLVRGDDQFENFVKNQKTGISDGNSENSNKSNDQLKCDEQSNISVKSMGNNLSGNFHEQLATNWNDLQSKFTEREKNSDDVLDKSESESSKSKPKFQKTVKKRPPEEVKVIGTDLDLQNILSPDIKRKRVSKELGENQSSSNTFHKKTPTTSPISDIKSESDWDEPTPKTKKTEKRIVGEKTGFKKKFLNLNKNKLQQK